ncbi:MAG TPA: flagellar biosynthetic protein FliQ [Oculatellaceae cyanobacterium]|jgi:flagellar biosynthesis protein FliQ
MELMMQHMGNGMMLSLMLSLPAVLIAASIGLVVGILQAVTQVQEQTIAAAPKILGVFAVLLLGGGLMMTMLENYVRESFHIAFNEIPQDGQFILPPKKGQTPGQMRAREFFQLQTKPGNADKLKDFAARWQMPEQENMTTQLKLKAKPAAGSPLGPAEKMAVTKH